MVRVCYAGKTLCARQLEIHLGFLIGIGTHFVYEAESYFCGSKKGWAGCNAMQVEGMIGSRGESPYDVGWRRHTVQCTVPELEGTALRPPGTTQAQNGLVGRRTNRSPPTRGTGVSSGRRSFTHAPLSPMSDCSCVREEREASF